MRERLGVARCFHLGHDKRMAEELDVATRKMLRYMLRICERKIMQNSQDTELEPWTCLGPCKLGCANGLLLESWLCELIADGHKLLWIGGTLREC